MTSTRKLLTVLAIASCAALGLAGCAASGTGGESSSVGQAAPQDAAAADPAEPDSSVVITGRITIVAGDPIAAARDATDIVTDAGGRVAARTERAAEEGGQSSAELTLRVPADAVEDVRTDLAALGTVKETALESAEVGATRRDLDARITTLRASIARYNEWLGTAAVTSDLIELETAISERQSELEGLEAQSRELADQVAMSTITLSLMSEYVPVATAPGNVGEALAQGWDGFVAFWGAMLIGLGLSLPWLVLLAAIALAVIWLVLRSRRARDARPLPPPAALDAALFAAPAEPPAPR